MTKTIQFNLGRIVATPNAIDALHRNNKAGTEYLARHSRGDWGDLCEADREANEESLKDGSRILSAYLLPDETKLWIITDAAMDGKDDRQVTTLLLPEDY